MPSNALQRRATTNRSNFSVGLAYISGRRCHVLENRCCTDHLLPRITIVLKGGIAVTKHEWTGKRGKRYEIREKWQSCELV